MNDLSEKEIKKNCPHCHLESQAFSYILEKTKYFYIVCDSHPLIEGHILIIPKRHVSCIAEYLNDEFTEFTYLNNKVSTFIYKEYKFVSSFEHGIFGQTVFHSHVHYLPFNGKPTDIIPEGMKKLTELATIKTLKTLFRKNDGYLFFSISNKKWSVSVDISAPRFFRDRFAMALGKPERGNWKTMHVNNTLMDEAVKENQSVIKKWKSFTVRYNAELQDSRASK